MKYKSALICSALLFNVTTALAEELSRQEMVCALNPQCAAPFVDRRLRGITVPTSPRPALSFDMTLNFAFDSAELTSDSREKLDKIASVLTDPSIKQYDININGYTDAKGTDDYNQKLSEMRAEAARQYLITRHAIDAKRLIVKGYGKSQLLLPTDPNNELNRRVQFQNANAFAVQSPAPRIVPKDGDGL
jgi:outer membrane protein OmpA-like peptidoglycan-associated protein